MGTGFFEQESEAHAYERRLITTPHPRRRQPKRRMAVTLVAAALACELRLKPGAPLPRVFSIDGKSYAIENGVARDMLKAGMIAVPPVGSGPEDEFFVLAEVGFEAVLELLGRDRLLDLGVLDPDSEPPR